jgi:uncharacterized protein (DUF2252 family)
MPQYGAAWAAVDVIRVDPHAGRLGGRRHRAVQPPSTESAVPVIERPSAASTPAKFIASNPEGTTVSETFG